MSHTGHRVSFAGSCVSLPECPILFSLMVNRKYLCFNSMLRMNRGIQTQHQNHNQTKLFDPPPSIATTLPESPLMLRVSRSRTVLKHAPLI